MKLSPGLSLVISLTLAAPVSSPASEPPSPESAPPVVVRTVPTAGTRDVNPGLTELRVTFSKPMQNGSWSWTTWGQEYFPETTGAPRFLGDGCTCVLPVKLLPGRFYATWLNSDRFGNFKDRNGTAAVPYLLSFTTADKPELSPAPPGPAAASSLNDNQRRVEEWTDRQFRSFFDSRTFAGWSEQERADLETRLLDTLNGPLNREYYQAINSLAALHSTRALPRLREVAFDRRDKDNRDRWMAVRALGVIGDTDSVPELIHLVYHGNSNTRWWAQISLVRLTSQNCGSDWDAWGRWWNDQHGQPAFSPNLVRWYDGQAAADQLAAQLAERDREFLAKLPPPANRHEP
jgi:hypothetical protein